MKEINMNANQLINSSYKIQNKWFGYYDQSTFGDEIADNDLGCLLTWNIEEAIEEYIEEYFEEYVDLKKIKNKELKSIKKSSLLTDKDKQEIKEKIVEDHLSDSLCEYCFYSVRKCENEEVFAVFTASIDGPGSVNPALHGIFKSIEDGRKSLIHLGNYVDEMEKIYF